MKSILLAADTATMVAMVAMVAIGAGGVPITRGAAAFTITYGGKRRWCHSCGDRERRCSGRCQRHGVGCHVNILVVHSGIGGRKSRGCSLAHVVRR